jgi:hypothetical protein
MLVQDLPAQAPSEQRVRVELPDSMRDAQRGEIVGP